MNRAIIVHCWGGKPEYAWYPWAKAQLKEQNFAVTVPEFPSTDSPKVSEWLPELAKVCGEPDDQLLLIGHSLGCITIMHYLAGLRPGQKVGGVILVAGNITDVGFPEISNFFADMPPLDRVRRHVARPPELIYSDDDPYVPLAHGKELAERIAGNLTILSGRGHFSGLLDDPSSCTKLPEVVAAAQRLSLPL